MKLIECEEGRLTLDESYRSLIVTVLLPIDHDTNTMHDTQNYPDRKSVV